MEVKGGVYTTPFSNKNGNFLCAFGGSFVFVNDN